MPSIRDKAVARILRLALLCGLTCHCVTAAAREAASEQSILAAMVFNFLKFTELAPETPGKSGGSLRLCIDVRERQQEEALTALRGRRVGGRELLVSDLDAASDACNVYFVDSRAAWRESMDHPALRQALTVSAYIGFVRDNGMIEIDVRQDGVRFDINLAQGRRAGIHFAPQLLRLARHLHD